MSYLVRRLLENTSNEGFLRAKFSENVAAEELLRDPNELLKQDGEKKGPGSAALATATQCFARASIDARINHIFCLVCTSRSCVVRSRRWAE